MKAADYNGKRFGKLLVVERIGTNEKGQVVWRCRCDCGKEVMYKSSYLKSTARSCGCLYAQRRGYSYKSHGFSKKIPEYTAWEQMKRRCYWPKHNRYHLYGGRGIGVCEKWKDDFMAFFNDVGKRPSMKHSLDRYPNKDGNYEPGNVRWATIKQQNRNKNSNVFIEYNGEVKCAEDWGIKFKIKSYIIRMRLKRGWPIDANLFSKTSKRKINRHENLCNNRYGRLVVLDEMKIENKVTFWLCLCDCGGKKWVRAHQLKVGNCKSCGCLQKEFAATLQTYKNKQTK